jgi:uncharacterized protein YacL
MLSLWYGLDEIIVVCLAIFLWLLPIILAVYVAYNFMKGFLKTRDERIKSLEARISQLEKEKMIDHRLDSLEKRFDEQQKK